MKLLLDTHTFIWLLFEPEQLSSKVIHLCNDPKNDLLVSTVSLWEIMIKQQTGKLTLKRSVEAIFESPDILREVVWVPIMPRHILKLEALPLVHRDPFDRLLIAQALYEDATLVSKDEVFHQYPVQIIW